MADTKKTLSDRDAAQVTRLSYNEVNNTLGVDGFLTGLVGRKIVKVNTSPTVETYSFYESSTLLYSVTITYTDNTKLDLSSVERTA